MSAIFTIPETEWPYAEEFNLDVAVLMLARAEVGRVTGQLDMHQWATLKEGVEWAGSTYDVIVDTETGLPVGVMDCQTARCAGGWVVTDAGLRLQWVTDGDVPIATRVKGGELIQDAASRLLGIRDIDDEDREDREDWDWERLHGPKLFHWDNEVEDLYAWVAWYSHTPVEDLEPMVQAKVRELQEAAVEAQRQG